MKHYMDIENLREFDVDLGGGMIRPRNDQAFQLHDHICISEKVDGSCASIQKDAETGKILAFSRKQKLAYDKTLNGFWNYAQTIDPDILHPEMIIFGEWTGAKNKIVYNQECRGKWYVFDIFDTKQDRYWKQYDVRRFCKAHGLDMANPIYDGPFEGWDHVRSFCHCPHYGDIQEGVVVKNITRLLDKNNRAPYYLKVVNPEFKESKVKREKDPEKEAGKTYATELAEQIVTENRVAKMLTKLRDEGELPSVLTPSEMKAVARLLPGRIFQDCVKEEPEIVEAMGEHGGRAVASRTMWIAKKLIVGD